MTAAPPPAFGPGDRVRHVSGWEDTVRFVWPDGSLSFLDERDYQQGSVWSPAVFTHVADSTGLAPDRPTATT